MTNPLLLKWLLSVILTPINILPWVAPLIPLEIFKGGSHKLLPISHSTILLFLTFYFKDYSSPFSSYVGYNRKGYNLMVSNIVVSLSFKVSPFYPLPLFFISTCYNKSFHFSFLAILPYHPP